MYSIWSIIRGNIKNKEYVFIISYMGRIPENVMNILLYEVQTIIVESIESNKCIIRECKTNNNKKK